MREIIIAIVLAALVVACTTTTRVQYESPDRQFELERHMELDGRA